MSLPVIDPFIRLAVGTESSLNFFNKPIGQAPLRIPRLFAHGTVNTSLSQGSVFIRYGITSHTLTSQVAAPHL